MNYNKSINKQTIFLVAFTLWTTINLFTHTTLLLNNQVDLVKFINIFSIFLLFIKEISSIYEDRKTLSFIGTLIAIFLLSLMFYIKDNSLGIIFFDFGLFIFSARDVEFNSIAKIAFLIDLFVLIITIHLSNLGFIPQNIKITETGEVRNYLGFKYVSFPSQIVFYMILCYLVFRNRKIHFFELLILELLNIYIYSKTLTGNPFIWGTISILYVCLSNNLLNKKILTTTPIIKNIIKYIFIIVPCIFFILLYKVPEQIFQNIDKLVHNRLQLSIMGIENWGISAFGNHVLFKTGAANGVYQYDYVDSFYVQQLITNGWIFTGLILILFTIVMIHQVKEKNDIMVMCLVAISCHAMFDPQLIWLWYSPFLLLIGKTFLKNMDFTLINRNLYKE